MSQQVVSLIIAGGGLLVSVITIIASYIKSMRDGTVGRQIIVDAVESLRDKVEQLSDKIDGMDRKLDDHAVKIVRIETRVDNLEDRVGRLEYKCEKNVLNRK